jgi:hypothetical protein
VYSCSVITQHYPVIVFLLFFKYSSTSIRSLWMENKLSRCLRCCRTQQQADEFIMKLGTANHDFRRNMFTFETVSLQDLVADERNKSRWESFLE